MPLANRRRSLVVIALGTAALLAAAMTTYLLQTVDDEAFLKNFQFLALLPDTGGPSPEMKPMSPLHLNDHKLTLLSFVSATLFGATGLFFGSVQWVRGVRERANSLGTVLSALAIVWGCHLGFAYGT